MSDRFSNLPFPSILAEPCSSYRHMPCGGLSGALSASPRQEMAPDHCKDTVDQEADTPLHTRIALRMHPAERVRCRRCTLLQRGRELRPSEPLVFRPIRSGFRK